MADRQWISIVVTVKNESSTIREFLESLSTQTRRPDEVIIVDGGSTDGTQEQIRQFAGLAVQLVEATCNIARGRNIGIRQAQYDAIAVTDAGCRLAPDWLTRLSEGLAQADVVVGNYCARITSRFDACQYSLSNLFSSDASLDRFTISSRSLAFRKVVWKEVGGYPEWLDYSEDAYFHDQIKLGTHRIVFERNAIVEWCQRCDMRGIFLQYFRYMRGEALGQRHAWRNILRFVTYVVGGVGLYAAQYHPSLFFLVFVGFISYLLVPVRKFHRLGTHPLNVKSSVTIAALLLYIDCAKMAGYASGIYRLLTKRGRSHTIVGAEAP